MHAYVLVHFVLLAKKVSVLNAQLRAEIGDAEVRNRLRRLLPINIFVQYLAGPKEVREGPVGLFLRLITSISLVVGPVALLVFFELQFLPYHDESISWWQRIAVLIDLLLLWVLWPTILHGEAPRPGWRSTGWVTRMIAYLGLAYVSLVSVLLVFAIATFPGEWLDRNVSWFPLRQSLVGGEVDEIGRRPTSLWSNRLVLPGLDVIDRTKFDTEAKIAAAPEMASLRRRNLEYAVLRHAVLRKVDFTGANLRGAWLSDAELQGASLNSAQLQGAVLHRTQLQGAHLDDAQLQGADLLDAHLQGASLWHARLKAADLVAANLEGAKLDDADLQGASLGSAHLEGASLFSANLQGSILDDAQLQGATLLLVKLQGASLRHVFVWRADLNYLRDADVEGARISAVETNPKGSCEDRQSNNICDWADNFAKLKRTFEDEVPESRNKTEILARLEQRLNPTKALDEEPKLTRRWVDLQSLSPATNVYEKGLAELWRGIGCAEDGAPFVLTELTHSLKSSMSSAFAKDSTVARKLAADFLKKHCAGARGISSTTRRDLMEFSSPPQKPATSSN